MKRSQGARAMLACAWRHGVSLAVSLTPANHSANNSTYRYAIYAICNFDAVVEVLARNPQWTAWVRLAVQIEPPGRSILYTKL